jgi:hypothetical protein
MGYIMNPTCAGITWIWDILWKKWICMMDTSTSNSTYPSYNTWSNGHFFILSQPLPGRSYLLKSWQKFSCEPPQKTSLPSWVSTLLGPFIMWYPISWNATWLIVFPAMAEFITPNSLLGLPFMTPATHPVVAQMRELHSAGRFGKVHF